PWELLAAMDDIVFTSRTGAYTDTAAARFNVPWLNLTTDQDARLVQRTLRQLLQEARVPEGVFEIGGRTLVSPEEATARYQADLDWFDQTNLLVISNGPFSLSRYDPPAQFAELTAFRPPDYPFSPEDFRFGSPPQMTLTAQAPASVSLAEPIEVPVTVNGPGALTLDYVLIDPTTGGVIASGRAEGDGVQFTVSIGTDVTATLFPSVYQLYLLAASDELSRVTEQRVDVNVGI
ncbi:MAG TPA: hypothetical protein VGR16_01890, partial [Thermomicrobiales bacterium]|nr:hypothetical protein [Thermomicrobiales bacterium]